MNPYGQGVRGAPQPAVPRGPPQLNRGPIPQAYAGFSPQFNRGPPPGVNAQGSPNFMIPRGPLAGSRSVPTPVPNPTTPTRGVMPGAVGSTSVPVAKPTPSSPLHTPPKAAASPINPTRGGSVEFANNLIDLLEKKWEAVQRDPEAVNFTWTLKEGFQFGEQVTQFLPIVTEVLKSETYPILKLRSPLLVLGDLHGAFDDLHFFVRECYDRNTEQKSPTTSSSKKSLRIASNVICLAEDGEAETTLIDQVPDAFSKSMKNFHRQKSVFKGDVAAPRTDTLLFLGDYVDRGMASVEVLVYLLAMKTRDPKKIYLLRGNHETEEMNELYGFRESCLNVFGVEAGKRLWKEFNQIFTYLPLAATIDEKIFCAHGGIPRLGPNGTDDRLSLLTSADWTPVRESPPSGPTNPTPQVKRMYQLFTDLMWADPHDPETDPDVDQYGFGESVRGEGCTYAMKAVEDFLQRYGFEMIFRAHQPKASGFHVGKGGKVVTVFSSSHYRPDEDNAAGAAFVDDNTVRAITRLW